LLVNHQLIKVVHINRSITYGDMFWIGSIYIP